VTGKGETADNVDLTFKGGLVVTPTGVIRGGVAVAGDVITHVGPDSTLPRAARELDVAGKVIFPGIIDPHVHIGVGDGWGPAKMRADFETESRDAAVGGITTMVTTTLFGREPRVEVLSDGIGWGNDHSLVDFRFTVVMVTRDHLVELPALVEIGARSFKFFLGYKGPQGESFGMDPDGVPWDFFYAGCEAIRDAIPAAFPMIHAEDPEVRDLLIERMRSSARTDYLQAWHEACPNITEPMQLYSAALIANEVGTPVYAVHVSAAESVDLIRDLRARGFQTQGETLTAFLYYTAAEADERGIGAYAKVQPPIRADRDRAALWHGVRDGTIQYVGSDTQMYTVASQGGDFWDARVGLGPGLATMFPATYTAGVLGGECTLEDLARVCAENSARRFDLYPQKGVLQSGSDADLIVFDPTARRETRAADLPSESAYTIYEGESLGGWPELVMLRGNVIVEDGAVVENRHIGRHVPATVAQASG